MTTTTVPLVLGQADVAELLGLSIRAVAMMRKRLAMPKSLPLSGTGKVRQLHWRREDIERWVAMGCPSQRDFERMRKG